MTINILIDIAAVLLMLVLIAYILWLNAKLRRLQRGMADIAPALERFSRDVEAHAARMEAFRDQLGEYVTPDPKDDASLANSFYRMAARGGRK